MTNKLTHLDSLKENFADVSAKWSVDATLGVKRTTIKITMDSVKKGGTGALDFFAKLPNNYHWLLRTAEEKLRLEQRNKELEKRVKELEGLLAHKARLRTRKPERAKPEEIQ